MTKILAAILVVVAATPAPAQVSGGPSLSWATYLGGSGNGTNPSGTDHVQAMAFDPEGNLVVVGFTDSKNFPVVGSVTDPNFVHGWSGKGDAFVAKFKPDGSILWSTYLGGALEQDTAADVVVDAQGSVYVAGNSSSADFPIVGAPPEDGQPLAGQAPGTYLAKFEPDGGRLAWSRMIKWTIVAGIALAGDAVVVVSNESKLQTTSVACDIGTTRWTRELAKAWDVTNTISYATQATTVTADAQGNTYIAGFCDGKGITKTTGAYQATYGGGANDGFVMKVDAGGNVTWTTLLGGTGSDMIFAMDLDSAGRIVVGGYTDSPDYPTTPGVYQAVTPGGVIVVTKLNATGTAIAWSTAVGTSDGHPSLSCLVVDGSDNVYFGGSATYSTAPFPRSGRGVQPFMEPNDGLIGRLKTDGSDLTWSSYLGGTDSDTVYCLAASGAAIYAGGFTMSSDFPVSVDGFDKTYGYKGDGFLARINDPVVDAGTSHLAFKATAGGIAPAGQPVRIVAGAAEFSWVALSDTDSEWIAVTPTSGVIGAGESTEVAVSVSIDGMEPGTYEGQVALEGVNGNYVITVTLVVTPPATVPVITVPEGSKHCSTTGLAGSSLTLFAALVLAAGFPRVR